MGLGGGSGGSPLGSGPTPLTFPGDLFFPFSDAEPDVGRGTADVREVDPDFKVPDPLPTCELL